MTKIKVEIEITIGELEEVGLAFTQHIGELKDEAANITGSLGYAIGTGEYRGDVKWKDRNYVFSVDAIPVIVNAVQNHLNKE